MRKLFILLVTLCSNLQAIAQVSIEEQLHGFDAEVEKLLTDFHAAGLSVAIVHDGSTVYTKGFGYRDVERKLPVDENTVFGIGSVTKSFTAALLGKLEDEGRLKLSDRPAQYIPELKFYSNAMDQRIRIKDVLSHSTGLSRMGSESSCVLFQSDNAEDLIPRLAHLKPEAGVGEKWLYCNYMYTLAGLIGARITGVTWADNIQKMIFEPLGMQNSYLGAKATYKTNNYSLGYAVEGNQPSKVLPEVIPTRAPAGDIYSTANDMAKWVNLWLNNGQLNGQQLLSPSYINQATSPQQIMWGGLQDGNPEVAQFTNYGYGWMNSNYKGYYKVEHSGGMSGYTSNVVFYPKEKIGFVVLANQTSSNLSYLLTEILEQRILGIQRSSVEPEINFVQVNNIAPADTKTKLNEQQMPTHTLDAYVGSYDHPGFGTIRVRLEEETLYADFPFTTFRLEHVRYNVFQEHFTEEVTMAMWPFMNLNFLSNAQGDISSIRINLEADPVEFLLEPKTSIVEVLKETLKTEGKDAALNKYWELKETASHLYTFDENEMNSLGYEYMSAGEIGNAIEVFKLNVATHPKAANAYDSLGEAYMKSGDKEQAIENYKTSVQLNPANQHGINMLKELGVNHDAIKLIVENESEEALIAQTLMDYIEGTANGEADRIRRAFHPALNLYAVDNGQLKSRSGQSYISIFEDGKKRNRVGKIISIDYVNDAAVAKVEVAMPGNNRLYTDYMMLLKLGGEWKIIHKSYTFE